MGIRHRTLPVHGVQYHPESIMTEGGKQILANFLKEHGSVESIIYLNGALLPASQARISPFDRGFLYGDGLFETMRSYNGRIHLLGRHLTRLRRGTELLGIVLPPDEVLIEALRSVIAANGGGDMALRLTVTRGPGGSVFDLSASVEPTMLITTRPLPATTDQPERLITLSLRRSLPELGIALKSLNYLTVVACICGAKRAGVREGVLLTHDGWVAEGTVSNIFCVRDGALITPPLEWGYSMVSHAGA